MYGKGKGTVSLKGVVSMLFLSFHFFFEMGRGEYYFCYCFEQESPYSPRGAHPYTNFITMECMLVCSLLS